MGEGGAWDRRRELPWTGHSNMTVPTCSARAWARPNPVGAFPAGASRAGALDMSGNVWEWTRSLWGTEHWSSQFGYPYNDRAPERENLEAADAIRRVVRGGSFDYVPNSARASNRSSGKPALDYGNTGFRVAVTSVRRVRRTVPRSRPGKKR